MEKSGAGSSVYHLAARYPGDFNGDSLLTVTDIDSLTEQIIAVFIQANLT